MSPEVVLTCKDSSQVELDIARIRSLLALGLALFRVAAAVAHCGLARV
jgi:hypothetical protein